MLNLQFNLKGWCILSISDFELELGLDADLDTTETLVKAFQAHGNRFNCIYHVLEHAIL